jgi:rRNA pseudouridine-1189 N-methylase Emg1 (Nep1/Mra1 family)
MLTIVIAEAELELVPEEALNERRVIESAKKRGKNLERSCWAAVTTTAPRYVGTPGEGDRT